MSLIADDIETEFLHEIERGVFSAKIYRSFKRRPRRLLHSSLGLEQKRTSTRMQGHCRAPPGHGDVLGPGRFAVFRALGISTTTVSNSDIIGTLIIG